MFWAKYTFLTLKRQFSQKHGVLCNFRRYSYNKITRKKRGLGLIERKEIERGNFRCVISAIEGPQKAGGTKEKYTFPSYFNLDLCEQFCKEIDYIETGKFCGY